MKHLFFSIRNCVSEKFSWAGLSFVFLGMVGVVLYLLFPPEMPFFQPDSSTYINFASNRTLGYPIFLWIIKGVFGSFSALPFIQLSLFMACLSVLAFQLYRFSGYLWLGLLLMIGVMANVEVIKYCFTVLTESITISLIILSLAALIRIVRIQKGFLLLGICVALAALFRPAAYAFMVLPLGMLVFYKRFLAGHLIKRLLCLIAPFCLVILLGGITNQMRYGFFSPQSFLGQNLMGKAALLLEEELVANSPYPKILLEITEKIQPIQDRIEKTSSLSARYLLSSVYYDTVRFEIAMPVIDPYAEKTGQVPENLYKVIALFIMKERPIGYFKDILLNLWSLWTLGDLISYRQAEEFNNFVKTHRGGDIYKPYPYTPSGRHPLIVYAFKLGLGGTFFISLGSLFWAAFLLFRKKPLSDTLLLLTFSAAFIHAAYLLIASVQAGIPRFALSMWPVVILLNMLIIGHIYRSFVEWRKHA